MIDQAQYPLAPLSLILQHLGTERKSAQRIAENSNPGPLLTVRKITPSNRSPIQPGSRDSDSLRHCSDLGKCPVRDHKNSKYKRRFRRQGCPLLERCWRIRLGMLHNGLLVEGSSFRPLLPGKVEGGGILRANLYLGGREKTK